MKGLVTCLMLTLFALPAHAGQGTLVETDDAIIVEYSGDSAEKPKTNSDPGAAPAAAPPAAEAAEPQPPEAQPVLARPPRVRDLSRRDRVQRPRVGPGTEDGSE